MRKQMTQIKYWLDKEIMKYDEDDVDEVIKVFDV